MEVIYAAVQDYKFFGYCSVTGLTNQDIDECRKHKASDKENRAYEQYYVRSREECLAVVEKMMLNREEWAREALFCTIASLLHKKSDLIDFDDVLKIMDGVIHD